MRYLFFPWAGITFALVLYCLSDTLFGRADWALFGRRLLLCFIWPLALLSPAGRKILFG